MAEGILKETPRGDKVPEGAIASIKAEHGMTRYYTEPQSFACVLGGIIERGAKPDVKIYDESQFSNAFANHLVEEELVEKAGEECSSEQDTKKSLLSKLLPIVSLFATVSIFAAGFYFLGGQDSELDDANDGDKASEVTAGGARETVDTETLPRHLEPSM